MSRINHYTCQLRTSVGRDRNHPRVPGDERELENNGNRFLLIVAYLQLRVETSPVPFHILDLIPIRRSRATQQLRLRKTRRQGFEQNLPTGFAPWLPWEHQSVRHQRPENPASDSQRHKRRNQIGRMRPGHLQWRLRDISCFDTQDPHLLGERDLASSGKHSRFELRAQKGSAKHP